jgi:hypothetical protein
MINTDKTMEEVRRIKEACSLRYLSQTPEERREESARVIDWFEKRLGRRVETLDSPKPRKVVEEELAQV